MPISVIASVLTAIGEIMIGISVLKVHEKLSKEKRVDEEVVEEVRDEHKFVFAGIAFIAAGLLTEIVYTFLLGN